MGIKLSSADISGLSDTEASSEESSSSGVKITNLSTLAASSSPSETRTTNVKLNSTTISALIGAKTAAVSSSSGTTGVIINGTVGQTYDLDYILASKRRDNSDMSLMAQIDLSDLNNEQFMDQVAKFVLDDAGVTYTEANYKTKIAEVTDFESKYESALEYYYKVYLTYYGKMTEGSISISTVLEKLTLCKEDYAKWLTNKDSLPASDIISGTNAKVIVEEGDDESGDSGVSLVADRSYDSTTALSVNTYNRITVSADISLTFADAATGGPSEYEAQLSVSVATAVKVTIPTSIGSVSYATDDGTVSISGSAITITAGNTSSVYILDARLTDIGYATLTKVR